MTIRERGGYMGMLTLTAGGDGDHQRWSVTGPRGDRPACDCAVGDLAVWNATHSARWNRLRTSLRREYPGLVFLRGVEVQDGKRGGQGRGALHDHAIVWCPVPLDLAVVQALALRAGFGCVVDWAPCVPGSRRAAYYVSKYVTKACDSRDRVPWLKIDHQTGEILSERATYRTWSASREWGMTMGAVRQVCRAAAARAAARQLELLVADLAESLGAVELVADPPPE